MAVLITLGGTGVIAAVASLVVVLLLVALPLLLPARGDRAGGPPLPDLPGGGIVLAGEDENRETAWLVTRGGSVEFVKIDGGTVSLSHPLALLADPAPEPAPASAPGTATAGGGAPAAPPPADPTPPVLTTGGRSITPDLYALGTSDGRILAVAIRFQPSFETEERVLVPKVAERFSFPLAPGVPLDSVSVLRLDEGYAAAATGSDGSLRFARLDADGAGSAIDLTPLVPGRPASFSFDAEGGSLVVGTREGTLAWIGVRAGAEPALLHQASAGGGAGVTLVRPLLGARSWIVGDEGGGVAVWTDLRDPAAPERRILQKLHELPTHPAPVVDAAAGSRNRSFLTADASGVVRLHHSTTARGLLTLPPRVPGPVGIAFAPRGDGALAVVNGTALETIRIEAPHPEVSLRGLSGRIWYERAEGPAWVWQSTGGTDDFEPKLSVVPLVFGTIKGAFYALLFAIPIAIVAAVYTSQFAHPKVKALVKPTVELMAAMPSVVIGFLAGLWLAPILEDQIAGFLVFLAAAPVGGLLVMGAHRILGRTLARRPAIELIVLVSCALAVAIAAFSAGPWIERALFGGSFPDWLFQALGVRYDQRNSVVVGVALGFAVIPIIFTISEDALSNVPGHLTSASLALGANRWQTAVRVVLPTASPGISSAVMLGVGRAVGETMIVLMATGNTPLLSWSPWNGMRTLSANIAVEIPEAPVGGTLYRLLFLTAILLFVFTLAINSVAEMVSHRLRRRYARL